ncbi:hypothetical protein MUBE_08490 [Mycobacterium uberis]|uniref:Aminotransferase class I/classII large domain-containing protein n=2 Tax=Mycobacterium uberis TaxID=2162698 RepID=A0A3E1HGI6_9MYCO|nr:aminotransferase class I/II-fold pyridoxal phosphate-dependent enzyme [Mycobacterium uberis]RFD25560.1 hypothetical protein MUBE_08490 [Mycobacterium uberis]
MLNFAVNVRHNQLPYRVVQRLAEWLPGLARYLSADYVHQSQDVVADRHCRVRDEVMPLAWVAEVVVLLPSLWPVRAVIVVSAFTEPVVTLTTAGVPVHYVVLELPFALNAPEDVNFVVVGNPTSPIPVLHACEQLLALSRLGRILVVDEAFADLLTGGVESLAGDSLPDVLVLHGLTKTWSLLGLRVCYTLGSLELMVRLTTLRVHCLIGILQQTAIAVCCAAAGAVRLVVLSAGMAAGLQLLAPNVVYGAIPFVLFSMSNTELIRKLLQNKGIAVRRCDTFVDLDERYLRAVVRPEWPLLFQAIFEVFAYADNRRF